MRVFYAAAATILFASSASAQDLFDRSTLRTIELSFAQPDWESQLAANKLAGLQEYISADLSVDGVTYPSVGVRYKGNATYWSRSQGYKPPFNIDLKAFGVDQEVYGTKEIVLNNSYTDSSLLREVVSYRVLNRFTPSSRANFINLVINGEGYGIYTNVEHVGGKFTKRHFGNEEGFRYKAVPYWSWPDTITDHPGVADVALQDLNMSLSRAERAYDLKNRESDPRRHEDVLSAIDVLNSAPASDLISSLDPLLDTDAAMWHLAANNVLCSLDAYFSSGQNYYLYHDMKHDRLSIIPWDYNMAFGGYDNRSNPTMLPTLGTKEATRPLLSRIAVGGALRQTYLAHLNTINQVGLDPVELLAEIDMMAALIDAEVRADTKLGPTFTYNGWQSAVDSLKRFIVARYDFLATHPVLDVDRPIYGEVGHLPAHPVAGKGVRFFANVSSQQDQIQQVWARYRVYGVFDSLELFDDGLHGDGLAGDGLYANDLVSGFQYGAEVEYYFESRTVQSNGWSFSPAHASYSPHAFDVFRGESSSAVVINEFVAKNVDGPTDEEGKNEDWIELYNRGTGSIDLSGMYMTDDFSNTPTEWQIPAGTTLNPGATLHIWADEDVTDGPYHADFKLSASGDQIALVDVDGRTLLDLITFGQQAEDESTARLRDGEDLWVTMLDPTPFTSNGIACGARAYDALDAQRNSGQLTLTGEPKVGSTVSVGISGLAANQPFVLGVGLTPVVIDDESGISFLIEDMVNIRSGTANSVGESVVPIAIPPRSNLIGVSVYVQAGSFSAAAVGTNAVEVVICQ